MSRTNTEKRQEIERKVVRHLIRTMKSEGWNAINVFDGEETVPTKNEADVLDNVFGVDESRIVFRKAVSPFLPMRRTAVIVLGNDGWDCIADHSVSNRSLPADDFEAVMDEKVYPYCESLEARS